MFSSEGSSTRERGIAVKIEMIDLVDDVEHETEVSLPGKWRSFLGMNQALS